nr:calpain-like protease palb/rim13 [Quercus suber]
MSRKYTLDEARADADNYELQLAKSKSQDEALDTAIKAAEASMRTLKLAETPSEKAKQSQRIKQLLEQAERIKFSDDWRSVIRRPPVDTNPLAARVLKVPRSTRTLSKAEQIIILKAGFLNGFKFPSWTTAPALTEFELRDGEGLFTDTPELPLSDFQEHVLEGWLRPQLAMPPPSWYPRTRVNYTAGMTSPQKIDLVQDAVTDCSVVASLCAGVARTERGGHQNISGSMLHPYDTRTDQPAISENGKYIARLNFNGCFRKVVIDDRLPVSKTNRVIHVVDRQNPGLLWPALVEKAYLKVRGGYDFPGSNSGTDLWILTGWIPEQAFLQADEFDPDQFWKRVQKAFDIGDVMVTMGTGKMSHKTEKELGLAGEHDYAVLDVREVEGQCLMLVKNPWCEGISWRGRFAGARTQRAMDGTSTDETHDHQDAVGSSRDLLNADEKLSPGTFWIDLDNIVQYFESVYLNWNPGLFGHRQDIHFKWDLSHSETGTNIPRGRFASLAAHPQFQVTAAQGGTIWVLLWRHFRNIIPAAATEEEIESNRYHLDVVGHITLIAFSTHGSRVLLPESHLAKGWFVDSPQTLLRLDNCDAGKSYTIVPLEQDLAATDHTFTISTFSSSPLDLTPAKARSPHINTLSAAWTSDTAGGNAHSPQYFSNPQFTLTVPQHTRDITLLLESCSDDLNVHVKLVHSSHGRRVHTLQSKDIITDSKDYRRGCCVAGASDVVPGVYTIICSTFEPQQIGAFALTVESSAPVQLALLPKEGAGRVRLRLPTANFPQSEIGIACPLVVHRLARVYVIARSAKLARSASERSLLRLSLSLGRGPTAQVLITSRAGEFVDSASGLRLDDVDLSVGHGAVWLVLERMNVGVGVGIEESFEVELLVDQIDAIECGEWYEWR